MNATPPAASAGSSSVGSSCESPGDTSPTPGDTRKSRLGPPTAPPPGTRALAPFSRRLPCACAWATRGVRAAGKGLLGGVLLSCSLGISSMGVALPPGGWGALVTNICCWENPPAMAEQADDMAASNLLLQGTPGTM